MRWPWQKKQQAEEGEGGDDITNSPVFLQKKVGVLQNELVQLDKDIAAAEAKKQENWDEWGSQIENMRNEFAAVKRGRRKLVLEQKLWKGRASWTSS